MKKLLLPILLFAIYMPFVVKAENNISPFCDICSEKGIREYYVDNLKIGQELNTGDVLYLDTPTNQLIDDEDIIANLYPYSEEYPWRPGQALYVSFYFDGVNKGYSNRRIITGGYMFSTYYSNIYSNIDFNKNIYWKLDKVEKLAGGEASALYFKSYKRTIHLNIINLVNNVDKFNVKNDEILLYSVKVQNTGDGYSENNIISAVVPKGLEIDKNRISDNGIYNEEDSIITWNLEELNPNSEYTFNYYAKVINSDIKEYIGYSYLTSNQAPEKVVSGNTIVSVENKKSIPNTLKNPNTGTDISMIIIVITLLVSSITYTKLKRKKNHIIK